jgi:hypothetical protein
LLLNNFNRLFFSWVTWVQAKAHRYSLFSH